MSPIPYLPGGADELPAARFILFATPGNQVLRVDESKKTLNGASFIGVWETGSLNGGLNIEKTIQTVTLMYTSTVDTTATLRVSRDGGQTWPESRLVDIHASAFNRIRRARLSFNTSGYDIRVRIELDTDEIFHIVEMEVVLIPRGEYVVRESSA